MTKKRLKQFMVKWVVISIGFFLLYTAVDMYVFGAPDHTKTLFLSIVIGLTSAATDGVLKKAVKSVAVAMHGKDVVNKNKQGQ